MGKLKQHSDVLFSLSEQNIKSTSAAVQNTEKILKSGGRSEGIHSSLKTNELTSTWIFLWVKENNKTFSFFYIYIFGIRHKDC